MKKIPLTRGLFAIVDDEDYEKVIALGKWQAQINISVNSYYAIHSVWNGNIRMHRFIMNTPSNMVCDHINGNTLDNRKSNLRNCTQAENKRNTPTSKNNKLNEKGIYKTNTGSFEVRIRRNWKTVYRKSFKNLEDAIKARDEQYLLFDGEFVNTK